MDKDIIELLIKKHGESLTPAEEALLQQWCETSGRHKEFYQLANGIFNSPPPLDTNTENAWKALQQEIQTEEKQKKQKTRKIFYTCGSIAASLLILFGIAFSLFHFQPEQAEKFYEIHTAYGQVSSLTLPDSSKIWLAGGSHIKYPYQFSDKKRWVELEGEAFFDVCKGKGEFTVITGEARTVVKGTRFNIKAYQEDSEIETTLVEGKVNFLFHHQEIPLQPEEKIIYNKSTGNIEKQVVTYFNCCIDDEFRFENQRIEEVMLYLKRLYNVHTNFEKEDLKELRYSGVIRKSNTLEHTLEVIVTTLNIQGELSDHTILLKEQK